MTSNIGNFNLMLLHTSLTTLHPYRICPNDSQPPHKSHTSSLPIPLARNRCLVGSIFEHVFHINILTLFGQFKPQICFQRLFIPAVSEHSPLSNLGYASRKRDWATLYALLTGVCCSFMVELKFLYMDYSCNINLQQIYISVFSVLPHL